MSSLYYKPARKSEKTTANVHIISPFVTIDILKRRNKVLIWACIMISLAAILTAVSSLMYNYTINEIKRENEAKNAQIERLENELLQCTKEK